MFGKPVSITCHTKFVTAASSDFTPNSAKPNKSSKKHFLKFFLKGPKTCANI